MKLLLTLLIRIHGDSDGHHCEEQLWNTACFSYWARSLNDFGVQKPCNPKDCGPQIANSLNHPGDRGNVWLWLGAGTYDPFANNNFGAATMVELTLNDATSKQLSVDISRVAGFNVGVAVYGNEKDPWKIVCKDVNCHDAYFLCDARPGDATYSNPCFSPGAIRGRLKTLYHWVLPTIKNGEYKAVPKRQPLCRWWTRWQSTLAGSKVHLRYLWLERLVEFHRSPWESLFRRQCVKFQVCRCQGEPGAEMWSTWEAVCNNNNNEIRAALPLVTARGKGGPHRPARQPMRAVAQATGSEMLRAITLGGAQVCFSCHTQSYL